MTDAIRPPTEHVGRAYGRKPGVPDPVLTQVGPGTPGGEMLRRYWQPIALSSEATAFPKQIRRYGEDLILFRAGNGEVGLVTPYCIHRGASLYYGKVEEDGIRCAYHGWKFGCQGAVLDQPCEPERGRSKHRLRQPWYPVIEKFGAVWAYMGSPEKQPLFPIFSCFDQELGDDELIIAIYMNEDKGAVDFPSKFNWFQHYDNGPDHYHIQVLHWDHSGPQFYDNRYSVAPQSIEFAYSDKGDSTLVTSRRDLGNGETWVRLEQILVPNIYALPPFHDDGPCQDLWFFVPFDDTTYVQMSISRVSKSFSFDLRDFHGMGPNMKLWSEMSSEEHQRYPSDSEVQGSQWGGLTCHSEENLAGSDVGVVKNRLLWKRQVKAVQQGGDPVNTAFREEDRRIEIVGGSWMERDGRRIEGYTFEQARQFRRI